MPVSDLKIVNIKGLHARASAKLVEVASQSRLEAEQKKLAAAEYKQEQTLRGEGDAAYKRLVMKADGALQQKLEIGRAHV